jgi:hypothetical protein
MLRRMAAVLVLATLVTSCVGGGHPSGSASPSAGFSPSSGPLPSGGLTQAEADAAAMAARPDATGVVSAKVGRMRDFDTGQQVWPGDQWVWAVVVSGTFPFSCGPAPETGQTHAPCPPPAKTQTVLLDYWTGKFLLAFGQSGS